MRRAHALRALDTAHAGQQSGADHGSGDRPGVVPRYRVNAEQCERHHTCGQQHAIGDAILGYVAGRERHPGRRSRQTRGGQPRLAPVPHCRHEQQRDRQRGEEARALPVHSGPGPAHPRDHWHGHSRPGT